MDHQTDTQTNHQFRRLPKGERRVRFADSMGMELVSIFLFDLISNYYFASIHNHKQLPAPRQAPLNRTSHKPALTPKPLTTTLASNQLSRTQANSAQDARAKQQVASQSFSQEPLFVCEFTQPISLISFKERVKLNKVHLETCSVFSRAGQISLTCTIRVLNESYDKAVIVRYTTDEWHTSTDTPASYKPASCDGWSDRFTSTVSLAHKLGKLEEGQRIIFAIMYTSKGQVYWDNNAGLNYSVRRRV